MFLFTNESFNKKVLKNEFEEEAMNFFFLFPFPLTTSAFISTQTPLIFLFFIFYENYCFFVSHFSSSSSFSSVFVRTFKWRNDISRIFNSIPPRFVFLYSLTSYFFSLLRISMRCWISYLNSLDFRRWYGTKKSPKTIRSC